MAVNYGRTDLALESKERFERDHVEIAGVQIEKHRDPKTGIRISKVKIESLEGAKILGKPLGTYLTLEDPGLLDGQEENKEDSRLLAESLLEILGNLKGKSVLVVGLGNREITPDALGPQVLDHLEITRHLREEMEIEILVSGIAPGVMAQTGMETLEIIQGIVKQTHPQKILVIDALAARSSKRLGCTIQIADTGIYPGSGVGNHRCKITEETTGVPVVAIGVPTVVDAASIFLDYSSHRAQVPGELRQLFVTPKNIDEMIRNLSRVIADALNIVLGLGI